eukprot:714331_1
MLGPLGDDADNEDEDDVEKPLRKDIIASSVVRTNSNLAKSFQEPDVKEIVSPDIAEEKSHYNYEATFRSFVDPQEADIHVKYYSSKISSRPKFFKRKKSSGIGGLQMHSITIEEGDEGRVSASPGLYSDSPLTGDPSDAAMSVAPVSVRKYGTWDGVFTNCLLNIFGVIMFLRLGWVIGQAGIGFGLAIIWLAAVVVVLTGLSMSAISTNGEVKSGGAYYMISRALGPSVGGAIGVIFSIGNSVAIALYVIGFMETLTDQLKGTFTLTGDVTNDIRVFGLILVTVLLIMALIGVGWVIKLQMGLLALLVVAIISFIAGTFFKKDAMRGIEGYGTGLFSTNFGPKFTPFEDADQNFFTVFSVFFPAVTGIMAGANISGDLKNPSEAIPVGTLTAVGVSTIVYSIMAIMIGAVARRTVDPLSGAEAKYGLLNDLLIMTKVSAWGPLIYAGIYAATFSSALASLVGAPRILMSVAKDDLLPFLAPFNKTRKNGDPVRAYIVCFLIACACILIGKLNAVAPLITMFFMMTYALINFSCFQLSMSKSPGWRPEFRWYNKWTALAGAFLCFLMMFVLNYIYAFAATAIALSIWLYIGSKDLDVNWGSATEGKALVDTIQSIIKLRTAQKHVKNFRPHYLVLCGDPDARTQLVNLVYTLRKGHGAVFLGNVEVSTNFQQTFKDMHESEEITWSSCQDGYFHKKTPLSSNSMTMFMYKSVSSSLLEGCYNLLQTVGVGRVRPNTVLVGYKKDWSHNVQETENYVNIIRASFALNYGVMIARGFEALEFSKTSPDPFGTVDIWWLFDDGGLTVLIPYIMAKSDYWQIQTDGGPNKVPVRLLIISEKEEGSDDLRKVIDLLQLFRINWVDPVCVSTGGHGASQESLDHYNKTIAPRPILQQARPEVTSRWVRVAELMKEHSQKSRVVYCSMPFPRESVSAMDFMSWLELLSEDMPPMILMRGN